MWKFLAENYDKLISGSIALISALVGVFVSIRSGKLAKAKECMEKAIKEAEGLLGITGEVKKEIVLSKIRDFCNNIHFKFNLDFWSKLINECVDLMNANARIKKGEQKDEN